MRRLSRPNQSLTDSRDLAESVDRISELQEDNRNLLSALQTLIGEPGFDAQKHPGIVDFVNNVSLLMRQKLGILILFLHSIPTQSDQQVHRARKLNLRLGLRV